MVVGGRILVPRNPSLKDDKQVGGCSWASHSAAESAPAWPGGLLIPIPQPHQDPAALPSDQPSPQCGSSYNRHSTTCSTGGDINAQRTAGLTAPRPPAKPFLAWLPTAPAPSIPQMSIPHSNSLPGPWGPLHSEPHQPSLRAIQDLLSQYEGRGSCLLWSDCAPGRHHQTLGPQGMSGAACGRPATEPLVHGSVLCRP